MIIFDNSVDWLKIHDGDNTNAPVIGNTTFCGSDAPEPLVSSGRELYIHFHSDRSVSKGGFNISVSTGKCSSK